MNIDTDALKTATEWFMQDIIGGLKPIAGEVLPIVLKGISELNRYEEAGR
jgi:hypothetical protein